MGVFLTVFLGVGPMTVAMLLQNTFECSKRRLELQRKAGAPWLLRNLSLSIQTPVPR